VFFPYNYVFFSELYQFCCSAGVLPAWCVYTHWHREKTESGKYIKIFEKTQYLMNTLYLWHDNVFFYLEWTIAPMFDYLKDGKKILKNQITKSKCINRLSQLFTRGLRWDETKRIFSNNEREDLKPRIGYHNTLMFTHIAQSGT